jgi:hypothetical protein
MKRNCIRGYTHDNIAYSGHYKYDTNTMDIQVNPMMGEYLQLPNSYGGIYLKNVNDQEIYTNSTQPPVGIGVVADPGNQLTIGSAYNIELPDIVDKTIKTITIVFLKHSMDPNTILSTDAIPTTTLSLDDYTGTLNIYYELNSEPGSNYNWVWSIIYHTSCDEVCSPGLRRLRGIL